jgi:iron complex outermembrane receptor protein
LSIPPALFSLVWGQDIAQNTGPTPAERLKNLSLEDLSRIEVVSPSKQPTPVLRSPVAIYVITGEDIRRSGATSIPQALRLAPGVEVGRIDGSRWSVGIRGFGTQLSRSVLVLIDGRTVYTTLFAGTYWDVQDTLLEDIDRIEVIRGPGGTVWGPNAVNGVINIITKHTRDTQGTFVSAGGGSLDQGFVNARYGGSKGSDMTYRVYAKAFDRGPEYHPGGDNFDDWRGTRGGFRMDWAAAGKRDSFTVQGDVYAQRDGDRASVSSYVPALTYDVDQNAELSGGNVMGRWRRTSANGREFQVQAYYDRTNRREPNLGETRDTFDIDLSGRIPGRGVHEILYGLGARASIGRFTEVGNGLTFDPLQRTDYLISGFLQDNVQLVPNRLMLAAGSKVLRTNFTGVEFEPSVRLMWTPGATQTVWAAYTHAIRTPSRVEEDFYLSSYLGLNGGTEFFARFNPNRHFATEQMNGYELGYRTLVSKSVYVDFAGYFNHYHNLFSQNLAGPIFLETTLPFAAAQQPPPHLLLPAQFRNDLFGFTSGFEVAPEWRPTKFWRLRSSYSYLNMNLDKASATALGGTPASVAGSSPRHEAGVESGLDVSRLQLDLRYRYVSALPAQGTPSYSTGDVRAAWRLSGRAVFSVVGQNLFQPYHFEYGSDPGGLVGIRRAVYASIAWTSAK